MKIELILIGGENTLSPDSILLISTENSSVTQITQKMKNKKLIIDFFDQSGKTIPLSRALIPKMTTVQPSSYKVIATELKFQTEDDKRNFNETKKDVEIRIRLTVYEQETFLTHSEQNKIFQEKYAKQREEYIKELQNYQKQYSDKIEEAIKPYEKVITALGDKIEQLSTSKLLFAISSKENMVAFISKVIDKQSEVVTGMKDVDLKEQLSKLMDLQKGNKTKIDASSPISLETINKLIELEKNKNDVENKTNSSNNENVSSKEFEET
jgi:regulator of extracellular matrix RemA (YlzA/DUF370 family)